MFLECWISLTGYAGANKQLVLIFGFDVQTSFQPGRVLVYTDAGPLPQPPHQLVYGDNQFVLEIDSLDQAFYLYFVYAGGWWFFRELSGIEPTEGFSDLVSGDSQGAVASGEGPFGGYLVISKDRGGCFGGAHFFYSSVYSRWLLLLPIFVPSLQRQS